LGVGGRKKEKEKEKENERVKGESDGVSVISLRGFYRTV
jgi:hypothetical protein